ncbi:MAG: hypothetical protein U5J95_13135 [Balneolaceae bacterium]|nr:hypothetical protein [Balneolaceae bacterium]
MTFEPGKQRGKAVRVQYALPVNFTLGSNSNSTSMGGLRYSNREHGYKKHDYRKCTDSGRYCMTPNYERTIARGTCHFGFG